MGRHTIRDFHALGPGSVNFTPSGTGVTLTNDVSGASTANDCAGKWVTF